MDRSLLLTILLSLSVFLTDAQTPSSTYLFVGSYTDGKPGEGIHVYEFNSKSGRLKKISSVENVTNPSWLTISENGKYIYACTDTKIANAGSITAFKMDSIKGALELLNRQQSGGENPVFILVTRDNRFILGVNYTDGNISIFRTNENGSIKPFSQLVNFSGNSINKERQEKAHLHAAVFSEDQKYIFLPDLGSDKIRVLQFDSSSVQPLVEKEELSVNTTPGSGPRHFTFSQNRKFAYCVEELSGTVCAYSFINGKLETIQRLPSYSNKLAAYSSADIHISPDGRFLYTSNRSGENTIAIFAIEQSTGKLALVGHQPTFGEIPRNFTIDPTGQFLLVANQKTNNIVVFKRNLKTGLLKKVGKEVKVNAPSCLQMREYKGQS